MSACFKAMLDVRVSQPTTMFFRILLSAIPVERAISKSSLSARRRIPEVPNSGIGFYSGYHCFTSVSRIPQTNIAVSASEAKQSRF
jgi:hypothetical protein